LIIAPEVFDIQKHPARNAERVARIKRLVSGDYEPRGLFDVYYGKIDPEEQKDLPAFSYLPILTALGKIFIRFHRFRSC